MMTPAKNGMLMSSAPDEARNTEGGGALKNGKASIISGLRSRFRPIRCNWAERDSSEAGTTGSNSDNWA